MTLQGGLDSRSGERLAVQRKEGAIVFDRPLRYCPVCAHCLVEQDVGGVLRPVCSACSFIVFLDPKVVAVVVVWHEGKFLLGKRSIEPGKGKWSFFGGYVQRGEKVEEAAMREVKEETNLDVQIEGLIGVYSERGDPHVLIVYQAGVSNDQVKTLAQVLRRPLRYQPLSDDQARAQMAADTPAELIDAFFRFFSAGEFDDSAIATTVHDVTGRPPRTFERWAHAHTDLFGDAG